MVQQRRALTLAVTTSAHGVRHRRQLQVLLGSAMRNPHSQMDDTLQARTHELEPSARANTRTKAPMRPRRSTSHMTSRSHSLTHTYTQRHTSIHTHIRPHTSANWTVRCGPARGWPAPTTASSCSASPRSSRPWTPTWCTRRRWGGARASGCPTGCAARQRRHRPHQAPSWAAAAEELFTNTKEHVNRPAGVTTTEMNCLSLSRALSLCLSVSLSVSVCLSLTHTHSSLCDLSGGRTRLRRSGRAPQNGGDDGEGHGCGGGRRPSSLRIRRALQR